MMAASVFIHIYEWLRALAQLVKLPRDERKKTVDAFYSWYNGRLKDILKSHVQRDLKNINKTTKSK